MIATEVRVVKVKMATPLDAPNARVYVEAAPDVGSTVMSNVHWWVPLGSEQTPRPGDRFVLRIESSDG